MTNEITHKEHLLLKKIKRKGGDILTTERENLQIHWQLVRLGFLKNLIVLPTGWRFIITEEAEKYLKEN